MPLDEVAMYKYSKVVPAWYLRHSNITNRVDAISKITGGSAIRSLLQSVNSVKTPNRGKTYKDNK
eukprot:4009692-Ditylum_brightwellii.AAC.1